MTRTGFITIAALSLAAVSNAAICSAQDTGMQATADQPLATMQAASESPASLAITFTNIAAADGQIMLVLFDSEESYDRGGKPARALVVPVTGATATATIQNLAPGRYGFKIVHDLNGDGTMTTNPFGMPIEPFAFSNNAVGNMGPAKWDAAAFDVAGPTTQTISFR